MKTTDLNIILSRIKEKVPLSQIIGKDIVLQKKGREFSANCPFHMEKTGSFFVNDDKGTFYCFGCGASGDIVEYLMKKRGINFEQAIEILSSISGIKLPEKNNISTKTHNEQKILQKIIEFYYEAFKGNNSAKEYCKKRGLDENTIAEFSIGYAPTNGDSLYKHLRNLGFSDYDIINSGCFIKKDNKSISARFKDRLMFPVFDRKGWPIAFGGRGLQKDAIPKYLNSPESELFQKRETLYAYNLASRSASKTDQIIVVEGYLDAVMMHKNGFKTTVASMGTAFSADQLLKIWKYSTDPIISFDGDNAGYNAMVKIAFLALKHITPEKRLRFCLIPQNEDPDSFIKNFGSESMRKALNESLYLIDFIWEHFKNDFKEIENKTPEHIAKWKKDIFEVIDDISNAEIKQLYKEELKNRVFDHLRLSRKNTPKTKTLKNIVFSIDKDNKILLREAVLLYTMIVQPSIISGVIEKLSLVDFSDKDFEKIRDCILELDGSRNFDSVFEKDMLNRLKKIAGGYCQFDEMNDVEILNFWNDIFNINFSARAQKNDIIVAKEECLNELNTTTWDRLKALKMYGISNRKKS